MIEETAPEVTADPAAATLSLVVAERRREAAGIVSLLLRAADGARLPGWDPGAHLDLHLPSGLVRQYSLCSDPGDAGEYRIAVLDVVGGRGGSAEVHRIARGDVLRTSAPRNTFPLVDADAYLLIAGGIGITPILAMARHLGRAGLPVRLLYVGRQPATMAFVDDVLVLPGVHAQVWHSDEHGLPDLAALLDEHRDSAVFACGPAPMLDTIAAHRAEVHLERFTPAAAVLDGDRPFEVELARQGRTIKVPAGMSILEALRDAGLDPATSCEQGICGTCETGLVAGRADHRDDLLTDDERAANTTMMICVSRALDERLVLDL